MEGEGRRYTNTSEEVSVSQMTSERDMALEAALTPGGSDGAGEWERGWGHSPFATKPGSYLSSVQ